MPRIFNSLRSTFKLIAADGASCVIRPGEFMNLADKFTHDITYQRAIAAGEITEYTTQAEGDELERSAHEDKAEGDKGKRAGRQSRPAASSAANEQ